MKISSTWIKELVPGLTLSGKEMAELLTAHSFETVVDREYVIDPKITVVKILKLEPHPNADRLRLATITDGTQEIRVVCGAPNISEGDVVPYSPPGTCVYDENGESFELSVAKIRGVESPGMLNSARELGLSNDHGGIFLLPKNLSLGSKLIEYIQGDTLLEVDVLPDRAHDCLSHVGISKEVAALTGLSLQEPVSMNLPAATPEVDGFIIHVENDRLASRYMGIVLGGVDEDAVTPIDIQARLLVLGMRPLHPVVDITNYVTLEYGNPSHAFDADKLPAKEITVTETTSDVVFGAVDGKQYTPVAGDPLIQSSGETIALAGVIGGEATAVDQNTKNIFLEVATFSAFAIQESARHVGLRTEASSRFSKGLSPVLAGIAASRLSFLLSDIAHTQVIGVLDSNSSSASIHPISFRPSRVSAYAGTEISFDDAEESLTKFGFSIEKSSPDEWDVIPPAQRLDVAGEHDVIDEVIRAHGLNAIPASSAVSAMHPVAIADALYWKKRIQETLVQLGFTETYSYSFEDERFAALVNSDIHPHVELINPIAPEMKKLRYSMLPGLISAMVTSRDEMHRNKKGQERALFEIGRVYHVGDGGVVPGIIERPVISGIAVGNEDTLLRVIDTIRDLFELEAPTIVAAEKPFASVQRLEYAGEFFGMTYVLSGEVLQKMKYRMPVVAFEISFNALLKHAPDVEIPVHSLQDVRESFKTPSQFTELPKFPSVFRDISVLVDSKVSIDALESEINQVGGVLVVDVDLFDEYQKEGEVKKSLAFHVEYRSAEKTLNDSEVTEIHKKIEHTLKKQFEAEIR